MLEMYSGNRIIVGSIAEFESEKQFVIKWESEFINLINFHIVIKAEEPNGQWMQNLPQKVVDQKNNIVRIDEKYDYKKRIFMEAPTKWTIILPEVVNYTISYKNQFTDDLYKMAL